MATEKPHDATTGPSSAGTLDPELAQMEALKLDQDAIAGSRRPHPKLAELSNSRKYLLLFIFAVAGFVDVCNVSGVGISARDIAIDTGLSLSQIVWAITSYSLCFSAFLLFSGRLSDVFSATVIFQIGFIGLGIISIVTSFVNHSKYGFLICRGIGGIFGSLTIPSSYNLIVHMYPDPKDAQGKLALLGVAGALGNIMGLVIAGICMLASYVWFFRVMAIICLVFSAITFFALPHEPSGYTDKTPRWKRLDFIGVLILMGSLICFILALTQGPIDGWGAASFIAPLVLSFPLGIAFFFWESRIPAKSAVLPSSVWKIKNIVIASLATLFPFAFWGTSQLEYSTYWQQTFGWKPIHVAAAALPQGLIGLVMGGVVQGIPSIITKPRYSIVIGGVLIMVAEILQVYSNGGAGKDYWKFCFPAFILGSAGAMICYFAAAINLIVYCPPEMAGVASAWTQVLAQVGGAVALAVQAGLTSTTDFADWTKSGARSFWFMFAWVGVLVAQYAIFYKAAGSPEEEHELARERIRAAGGDEGVLPQ